MADVVLSIGATSLVNLLIGELKLSRGVYKDIREIKDELEFIQSFLNDADSKADLSYSVRDLVKEVREMAYSIEDVIDEYILRVARDRQRNGLVRLLSRIAHPTRKLKIRSSLDREITKMKAYVGEMSSRNFRSYGLVDNSLERKKPLDVAQQSDPRVSKFSLLTEEEADVFVMEYDRDKLLQWMNDGQSKRIVISVVGMGGVGKTTLAKKIFDIQYNTRRFDCYAWITVSQSYKLGELLRSTINQFHRSAKESMMAITDKEIDSIEDVEFLFGTALEYLQEKRYLVVFDDVWNTDFWTSIRQALPDSNNGSRIIITTRVESVAYSFKESSPVYIHRVELLPEEKAWELFCRKAFQSDFGGLCPPELENVSRHLVNRCGGVPLAIAVMGGLLSNKNKSVSRLKILYENLTVYSDNDPYDGRTISRTLLLSFQDLPYHLKSCFLYLGVFPEHNSINCNRLVRLWIAEGFVNENGGKTLEEVAYEYLDELIRRNLVYKAEVKFHGKARSCRVHDLLFDLIVSKSIELSFCEVLHEHSLISLRRARRLSIQCDTYTALKSMGNSMTRSIFLFTVEGSPNNFIATVCADFKLLKVLDFQDAPLENLPKEVGNLFHLRYLSIRGTKIEELPKSIGKLHNLETLDIKYTHVNELPPQICRLLNLLYLLANNFVGGVELHEGFGCLKALQKLYYVNLSHGVGVIKELKNLRQLRKLGIMKLNTIDCKELFFSIENMYHLQSLHVASWSEDDFIDLQSVTYPPPLLQDVFLKGRLEKLPDWVAELRNLVKLYLISSRLIDDPLKVLQALPQLSLLVLHGAFDGAELYFEAEGFRQLKRLKLSYLESLTMVKIDNSALPILEELTIGPSPQLKEVPSGIQDLTNLNTLTFVDMPKEFLYNMRPDGGEDFGIVAHIPTVLFQQKNSGRHHTYTLSDMPKELYS